MNSKGEYNYGITFLGCTVLLIAQMYNHLTVIYNY